MTHVSTPCRADPPVTTIPMPLGDPPLAGKRVLFLGDSITSHGLYIVDLEYYLEKKYPTDKFDFYSLGISSETVSGLSEKAHPFPRPYVHERLWAAIDMIKPDVIFACYGMNDGIYHPLSDDRTAAFKAGIQKLIAVCKAAGAKLVILTPPPFDPLPAGGNVRPDGADDYSWLNPYVHYDDVLAAYAQWETTLPTTDAVVIDFHTALSQYLADQRKTDTKYSLSPDGIHPAPVGQLLMAQTVLSGLGLPMHSSDLAAENAALHADPLYALVQKRNFLRADGWTPYVGYTRGDSYKISSIDETETAAAALQSQIDAKRAVAAP